MSPINTLPLPLVHAYACPDCGQAFQVTQDHQHPDGEWVRGEDLRRFYQDRRWEMKMREFATRIGDI